jgi:hypothetical protein
MPVNVLSHRRSSYVILASERRCLSPVSAHPSVTNVTVYILHLQEHLIEKYLNCVNVKDRADGRNGNGYKNDKHNHKKGIGKRREDLG